MMTPPHVVSSVLLGPVWLDLGLSVLFVIGLLGQVRGHGGCLHHCFEAALPLLDVLLWVEDDDIHLGYVEHAQGHGGAQTHGHSQGGSLDEHLVRETQQVREFYTHKHFQFTSRYSGTIHQHAINHLSYHLAQVQEKKKIPHSIL